MKRLFLFLTILLLAACSSPTASSAVVGGVTEADGFKRADGPQPFEFPADLGPHPDYQTEWWYYTGNLGTEDGRRFGYQLTFFRRALEPADMRTERESTWGTDQIYLAHFAVSDIGANQFNAFERFSRGAAELAGAQAVPYNVWLEDWTVEEVQPDVYQMYAEAGDVILDLTLNDIKGPIPQGIGGYSQKGPEPCNASYYYSQTRMETVGTVTVPDGTFDVTGFSWKDHEYSTSALSEGQIGWDWFSIQLDDGTELMFYHVRREDGSVDPLSKGSFVTQEGEVELITYADTDYTITETDTWRSPHTGAVYPAGWEVELPRLGITLTIEPLMADQELNVSYSYWEGAVRVTGESQGEPVSGYGYVEMTGYTESMEDQF